MPPIIWLILAMILLLLWLIYTGPRVARFLAAIVLSLILGFVVFSIITGNIEAHQRVRHNRSKKAAQIVAEHLTIADKKLIQSHSWIKIADLHNPKLDEISRQNAYAQ